MKFGVILDWIWHRGEAIPVPLSENPYKRNYNVIIGYVCVQMPRIWIDYCQFLMDQGKITQTRRTFDRALDALPLTQHNRIWPLYIKFVRSHDIPETALRVYRRYLKVRV